MKEENIFSKEHPEFLTVTCLEWKHLLVEDKYKDIVTESLTYLAIAKRIYVYGFVIMPNHFHVIWQMVGDNKKSEVQRDFLKYTGQRILKKLGMSNPVLAKELIVNAKDRKHQVWERNSLGIPLWTPKVFEQKLDYIRFYEKNENDWVFLTHHEG